MSNKDSATALPVADILASGSTAWVGADILGWGGRIGMGAAILDLSENELGEDVFIWGRPYWDWGGHLGVDILDWSENELGAAILDWVRPSWIGAAILDWGRIFWVGVTILGLGQPYWDGDGHLGLGAGILAWMENELGAAILDWGRPSWIGVTLRWGQSCCTGGSHLGLKGILLVGAAILDVGQPLWGGAAMLARGPHRSLCGHDLRPFLPIFCPLGAIFQLFSPRLPPEIPHISSVSPFCRNFPCFKDICPHSGQSPHVLYGVFPFRAALSHFCPFSSVFCPYSPVFTSLRLHPPQ